MTDSLRTISVQVMRRDLLFEVPARTSRNTLLSKPSWLIRLTDESGQEGWGECSIIPGLSLDTEASVEAYFAAAIANPPMSPNDIPPALPAVRFAFEMAWNAMQNGGPLRFFPGRFERCERPIGINGLIWMADPEGLLRQAKSLLSRGFSTLKMKVGSMAFDEELDWLRTLRKEAGSDVVLRCDANGAFSKPEPGWTPLQKLEALAQLNFHSIEQPLVASDAQGLAQLCTESPLPIALDESLIGIHASEERANLLDAIRPHFLVLKPSMVGGFRSSQEWVDLAEQRGIGWWATSALESNIGLYAIAQWVQDGVRTKHPLMLQGLGTGSLYTNNIPGTMEVAEGQLINHADWTWPHTQELFQA